MSAPGGGGGGENVIPRDLLSSFLALPTDAKRDFLRRYMKNPIPSPATAIAKITPNITPPLIPPRLLLVPEFPLMLPTAAGGFVLVPFPLFPLLLPGGSAGEALPGGKTE